MLIFIGLLQITSTFPIQPKSINVNLQTSVDLKSPADSYNFLNFIRIVLTTAQLYVNNGTGKSTALTQFLRDLDQTLEKYDSDDMKSILNTLRKNIDENETHEMSVMELQEVRKRANNNSKKILGLHNNKTKVDKEFFSLLTEIFNPKDILPLFARSFDETKQENKEESTLKNLLNSMLKKYDDLNPDFKIQLNNALDNVLVKKNGHILTNFNIDNKFNYSYTRNDLNERLKFNDIRNNFKIFKTTAGLSKPSCGVTTSIVNATRAVVASNVEVFIEPKAIQSSPGTVQSVFY